MVTVESLIPVPLRSFDPDLRNKTPGGLSGAEMAGSIGTEERRPESGLLAGQ